jgi:hypothetical protein
MTQDYHPDLTPTLRGRGNLAGGDAPLEAKA